MAEPRTIAIDEPFEDIDNDLRHTEMALTAHASTKHLAVPFTAQRAALRKLRDEEDGLLDQLLLSKMAVLVADDMLNELADETKKAVLAASGQDYQAPLYRQLFGGQSPSELKKPVLGAQLATMRNWIGPLGASNVAAMVAISDKLVPAVSTADEALSTVALAQQKLDTFMAGPRTTFVGEVNALRKGTKGKISEIVHGSPDLHLPNDFADRFFLSTGGSRTPTLAELESSIQRLEAKLERQKAHYAALKEKEAKQLKAKQEVELAEKQAKLEAAEKRAEEAAQEIARLKAEMGQ